MANFNFILYEALTNPAVRFVRVGDGWQWDDTNEVMAFTPTYADTAITLAENANINGIPVKVPAGLPSGVYNMIFYDAASPANSDAYSKLYRIEWDGREIMGIPKDMGSMS